MMITTERLFYFAVSFFAPSRAADLCLTATYNGFGFTSRFLPLAIAHCVNSQQHQLDPDLDFGISGRGSQPMHVLALSAVGFTRSPVAWNVHQWTFVQQLLYMIDVVIGFNVSMWTTTMTFAGELKLYV
jgi:hypothetical protein